MDKSIIEDRSNETANPCANEQDSNSWILCRGITNARANTECNDKSQPNDPHMSMSRNNRDEQNNKKEPSNRELTRQKHCDLVESASNKCKEETKHNHDQSDDDFICFKEMPQHVQAKHRTGLL